MKTTLVNIRTQRHQNYVRIDRLSIFGNPYKISRSCTLKQSLEKYRKYFYNKIKANKKFRWAVEALEGQTIACWCVDKPINFIREDKQCHGEIILEYLVLRKRK